MPSTSTRVKLLPAFLILCLLATSFGGAFALPVYAESPATAATTESVENTSSGGNILAGIAAIGLIAVLARGGSSDDKAASAPSSPSSPSSSAPASPAAPPPSTGGTSPSTGGTSPTPEPQTAGISISASGETQALSLLNKDRAASGLPALKLNSSLTKLAENYAVDMIQRGYFSHYNPEGLSPFERMSRAGISYRTAGENLAINVSVPAAEQAFMNSSGHRANILNSTYTEVGIGVVHSPSGSVYVVQEFIGR